jgi:dienelactone hydrolase
MNKVVYTMRLCFFFLFFKSYCVVGLAQEAVDQKIDGDKTSHLIKDKPVIDVNALRTWTSLGKGLISKFGNYVAYGINNQPVGKTTLVLFDISKKVKKEFIIESESFPVIYFDSDENLIFKSADSLYLYISKTKDIKVIGTKVKSCKLSLNGSTNEWLAYELSGNQVVLYNVETGDQQRFAAIGDYIFDKNGNTLLLKNKAASEFWWIQLKMDKIDTIHVPAQSRVISYALDQKGNQFAFITSDTIRSDTIRNEVSNTLFYYKKGMRTYEILAEKGMQGILKGYYISGDLQFSNNSNYIWFHQYPYTEMTHPSDSVAKVEIWSYRDPIIYPEQVRRLPRSSYYDNKITVVDVSNGKIQQISNNPDEEIYPYPGQDESFSDFIIRRDPYVPEWWQQSPQPCVYLISLKSGTSCLLKKPSNKRLTSYSFSPHGRFLVYYDPSTEEYYCYDLKTGKNKSLTHSLPVKVSTDHIGLVTSSPVSEAVAGWHEADSSLLIYDNYDIWQLDPFGLNAPINITNGYGLKNNIKLRVINNFFGVQTKNSLGLANFDRTTIIYKANEKLLVSAFNVKNKYNGFYIATINKKEDPELLNMGPYMYYRHRSQKPHSYSFDDGMRPIKADSATVWLVYRSSPTEHPNYFITKDFRIYQQVSNIQPQTAYNWLTTELVNWKLPNGKMEQGVLYKPENFNPNKKYPIIFNYYEALSHRLFEYPPPGLTQENINIPWFVSRGYLIFTPDFNYSIGAKTGKPTGAYALDAVLSAVKFLSKLPYIDSSKIGLQGHSFGAHETNYIITHSQCFAAASEFAGVSDQISDYLSLTPFISKIEHHEAQAVIENGHELYGDNLWKIPKVYLDNSPVMLANKVNTPLLIVHNENDNQIPWRQGVEWYMALRRLGKKVWMLKYDNEAHTLYNEINALDYTIRLNQFFDYYLKNAPAPKWLTEGIPAKYKGVKSGFETDVKVTNP